MQYREHFSGLFSYYVADIFWKEVQKYKSRKTSLSSTFTGYDNITSMWQSYFSDLLNLVKDTFLSHTAGLRPIKCGKCGKCGSLTFYIYIMAIY